MKNSRSIIVGISGLTLKKNEISILKYYLPLGIILFRRNIKDKYQLSKLVNQIRGLVGTNCLILIDQEGGRVQRLNHPNCPNYPAADIFGKLAVKSIKIAKRAVYLNYYLLGSDLKNIGINVNCAPCLDVISRKTHSIIGNRSFSKDPNIVSLLGKMACKGLMDSGVLPIIKHIPGHGRASSDSHISLPIVKEKINFLEKNDFIPFRDLSKMPIAMTAHILYEDLDSRWPISQSKIANNYIKKKLNYRGILISDDIEMSALSGDTKSKIESIYNAGYDIILHCSGIAKDTEVALKYGKIIDNNVLKKLELSCDKIQKINNLSYLPSFKIELSDILKKYLDYNLSL
ncbi:MAG: beta-N-acetylhexosaminidase [Alphaproteobacteria bacterium]